MNNPFHEDWLRRFREDLRTANVDSLTANVEMAGLEVILDPEFCELVCQEDDRQVAILIGSLGEANSDHKANFIRLRAAYQYLVDQLDLATAAAECAVHDNRSVSFYESVLDAAKTKKELKIAKTFANVDDLQFALQLQVNTGNSSSVFPILIKWQTIDKSDLPWLKACRTIVKRGESNVLKGEALRLATSCEQLITIAPKSQIKVIQEMRIQWAIFAYKGKNGPVAVEAATQAYSHDPHEERRFALAKALILNDQNEAALEHLQNLLVQTLSNSKTKEEQAIKNKISGFNVLAAEDALIDINKYLKNKGLKPFLMSGTLLGYARQGELLAHDKDVDIGIIGWVNQFTVAEALLEAGHYKLDLTQLTGHNRFLMSAQDLKNGMAIDIFLFHEKNDHFLHGIDFDMNFTQNFKFSKFELKEIEFLDEEFYIPDNIDQNLKENYGDWKIPAPSYVVTVESPALCDTPKTRGILIYMEILKTIVKGMKPDRINRILDHLESTQNNILGLDVHQNLRTWCSKQLEQPVFEREISL